MSLTLKGPTGLGASKVNATLDRWDTHEQVVDELQQLGFHMPPQPEGEAPVITAELLQSTDVNAYADMMTRFAAWISWLEAVKADFESRGDGLKNARNALNAELKKKYKDDWERDNPKGPKAARAPKLDPSELNYMIDANPEYQEVLHTLQMVEQKLTLITGLLKGVSRSAQTLSRHIEVKKIDMNAQSMAGNFRSRTDGSFTPARHPHRPVGPPSLGRSRGDD